MGSFFENLIHALDEIEARFISSLKEYTVTPELKNENPYASLGGNRLPRKVLYRWHSLTETGKILQAENDKAFSAFSKEFYKVIPSPTADRVKYEILGLINWVEFRGGLHSDLSNPNEFIASFRESLNPIKELISEIEANEPKYTVIIPDTNIFVNHPDPGDYKKLVLDGEMLFMLTPTLLNELDEHKTSRKAQSYIDKVKKGIRRIDGWRNQGRITEGVQVSGITVKMVALEPDFQNLAVRLSSDNQDDRLLATAVEIGQQYPSSEIIIITDDALLRGKCEMLNMRSERL